MLFNCKKKEPQLTFTSTIGCYADKDKPECSLIEELREIQKELNKKHDLYNRRYEIMTSLYRREKDPFYCGFYDYSKPVGILYDIERKSCNYTDIEGLNKAIALLQEYKELTEKHLEHEQRKKDLLQRELEIKCMLGIN